MPLKKEPGFSGEMKLLESLPITIVDHRGDLIIATCEKPNSEGMRFRVCSNTVFRASPTLERLTRDSTVCFGGQQVLSLRDANTTALHTLLNIIHGHFAQVFPRFSDKRLLYDVLVLTHQFDMTHCLAPVAEKWFHKSYGSLNEFCTFEAFDVHLWISHELGHVTSTRAVLNTLLGNAAYNSDGQLVWPPSNNPNVEYRKMRAFETLGLIGN